MPSTVIRSFHYDREREELDILFTTGRRYRYRAVPPGAVDALRAAFSKGRHFNAHIRDVFDYEEIASVDGAEALG